MKPIKVAVIGVGNCASSLVQGVEFYRNTNSPAGLIHDRIGGYGAGEQSRDFVSVEDVVKVNLYFLDHPEISGIFNLGSGRAQPFNDVAHAVANAMRKIDKANPASLEELVKEKAIEYIPFPDALKGKYQCFTQADLTKLRAAGYSEPFLNVEQGVSRYIAWLSVNADFLASPL